MWLHTAKDRGLTFYVSSEVIGEVSYETSSWFTGYDEKFFYGKGAYHRAVHPKSYRLWKYYVLFRFRNCGDFSARKKALWYQHGAEGYRLQRSYKEYAQTLASIAKR